MKRRPFKVFFHALAGLSLVICATTVTLWLSGGWVSNGFHVLAGRWWYSSDAHTDGRIQIVLVHAWPTPNVGPPRGTTGAPVDAWINQFRLLQMESGRFRCEIWAELGGNATNWIALGRRLDVNMPFWAAAVMWLVFPLSRKEARHCVGQ